MCMLEMCVHVQTHTHETDIFIDLYFVLFIIMLYIDWKCLLFSSKPMISDSPLIHLPTGVSYFCHMSVAKALSCLQLFTGLQRKRHLFYPQRNLTNFCSTSNLICSLSQKSSLVPSENATFVSFVQTPSFRCMGKALCKR